MLVRQRFVTGAYCKGDISFGLVANDRRLSIDKQRLLCHNRRSQPDKVPKVKEKGIILYMVGKGK